MPFINISFGEAREILEDPSNIITLLREKRINPKEADLLEVLSKYNKNRTPELIDEIRTLCEKSFEKGGSEAFQKIFRFIKSENKRVAWVLFSRTFQRISYDDRNPLEDYTPRVSEVLTISSKYKII